MNKLIIIFFIFLVGCSEYKGRKLLFNCNGFRYTHMTKDSFQSNNLILKIESNTSLYIGDKTAEVYGLKQDICNNGHTYIRFGNCDRKNLIDYYSFDLVTHKLFAYDYYSESFRNKMNFPSRDDSLRGEYTCQIVDNNKVK